ncbi:hypothetical protein BCR35DRAFT_350854 [Leucosporidium creatinivorum]|uniref:LYC1 C-terminal domain-containing protein n=1 Tax=Leucosporidium creatinivorum TaxID=106004 RepID=A0A1Y2FX75_9BASI|nr:hypothetical protein BCR35DRAFT_350854 [Leucosporidium creatinivorum]
MTEQLILRQATQEQWLQSISHTHPQWGGGISLELYKEREKLLKESTGEMGGSLICWVLLPTTSSPDSLNFYSSCESYRRPILHLPPSTSSSPSSPKSAFAYSIASVFTPPQHRRHGYARTMMSLLHEQLRRSPSPSPSPSAPVDKGGESPLLSFLYSDVGNFYSTCIDRASGKGWEVQGTERTTSWELGSAFSSRPETPEGWETREITTSDLADVAKRDADVLTSSFAHPSSNPESATSNKSQFLILPTPSSFSWSIARSAYSFTARGAAAPEVWGFGVSRTAAAEGKDDSEEAWGYVLLGMDYKEKKAKLLRLRLPTSPSPIPTSPSPSSSPAELGAHLIHLAASLALQHGMTKLEAWNVDTFVLSALDSEGNGGKTERREDSESAVAWYGEGEGEGEGEVEWRVNEGYAWC